MLVSTLLADVNEAVVGRGIGVLAGLNPLVRCGATKGSACLRQLGRQRAMANCGS
jgi:hypothetical protein